MSIFGEWLDRRRWEKEQKRKAGRARWEAQKLKNAAQVLVTGYLRGYWPADKPVELYDCRLDGRVVGDWRITVQRIDKG